MLRKSLPRWAKSYSSTVRTYMDLSFRSDPNTVHRIEFELFGKKAPTAVENFAKLCTGEQSLPVQPAVEALGQPGFRDQFLPQLNYKGSSFHRVVPKFLVQGGDLVSGAGTEQLSIFGPTFDAPDETAQSVFDQAGLVGTAVSAPHLNGSQFFITTNPKGAPHLNGTCICFGKVVKGMEVIQAMEEGELSFDGRPLDEVTVVGSGEL